MIWTWLFSFSKTEIEWPNKLAITNTHCDLHTLMQYVTSPEILASYLGVLLKGQYWKLNLKHQSPHCTWYDIIKEQHSAFKPLKLLHILYSDKTYFKSWASEHHTTIAPHMAWTSYALIYNISKRVSIRILLLSFLGLLEQIADLLTLCSGNQKTSIPMCYMQVKLEVCKIWVPSWRSHIWFLEVTLNSWCVASPPAKSARTSTESRVPLWHSPLCLPILLLSTF